MKESVVTPNRVKTKLKAGSHVIGTVMNFVSTEVVELLALSGFDYVLLDGEHGPVDPVNLTPLVVAAERRGITALARCAANEPHLALRYMDTGLHGLLVPNIDSAGSAKAAVRGIHYPPLGQRGAGFVRANNWGMTPTADYLRQAKEETLVAVLIESMEGVDRLDEILSVEGVDLVYIGPADLRQSLEMSGQGSGSDDLARVIDGIFAKTRKSGRWAGIGVPDLQQIRHYADMGATCFSVQVRHLLFTSGQQYLAEARRHLIEASVQ